MGNRAVDPRRREGFKPRDHGASGGPGHLGGPRPQAPDRRTGQGYAHLGGVWPPCQPSSIACAQAHVGLAAKVLAGVGLAVPSALALPTHGGRERAPRAPLAKLDGPGGGPRWARAGEGRAVGRSCAAGPQGDDLGAVRWRHSGARAGGVLDLSSHGKRARLAPG